MTLLGRFCIALAVVLALAAIWMAPTIQLLLTAGVSLLVGAAILGQDMGDGR